MTKIECRRCGNPRETDAEGKLLRRANGKPVVCRICQRARCCGWYYANREKAHELSDRWKRANPDGGDLRDMIRQDRRSGRFGAVGGLDFDAAWYRENIRMQPCIYCGLGAGTNGADRVDDSKPHAKANLVPACKTCNLAKGGIARMTPSGFVEMCERVANFQRRLGASACA